jgi:hypothetical protein
MITKTDILDKHNVGNSKIRPAKAACTIYLAKQSRWHLEYHFASHLRYNILIMFINQSQGLPKSIVQGNEHGNPMCQCHKLRDLRLGHGLDKRVSGRLT